MSSGEEAAAWRLTPWTTIFRDDMESAADRTSVARETDSKGLHKIRYYGLWHPTRREHAGRARLLLLLSRTASADLEAPSFETTGDAADRPGDHTPCAERRVCPCCKEGHLIHIGRLYPKQASGP